MWARTLTLSARSQSAGRGQVDADGDARVGAVEVDGAEGLLGGGDQDVGVARVGDVAADRDRVVQVGGDVGRAFLVEIGDDDALGAVVGEAVGERATDARRPAGDHHNLAGDVHVA